MQQPNGVMAMMTVCNEKPYHRLPAKKSPFFATICYCHKSNSPAPSDHQLANLLRCWLTFMTSFNIEGAAMLLAYLFYDREKTKK
jgi:hypothetical protein